jgi:hypothetical protein
VDGFDVLTMIRSREQTAGGRLPIGYVPRPMDPILMAREIRRATIIS